MENALGIHFENYHYLCTVSVAFIGSTIALAVYCLKKKNNHVPPKSYVITPSFTVQSMAYMR